MTRFYCKKFTDTDFTNLAIMDDVKERMRLDDSVKTFLIENQIRYTLDWDINLLRAQNSSYFKYKDRGYIYIDIPDDEEASLFALMYGNPLIPDLGEHFYVWNWDSEK